MKTFNSISKLALVFFVAVITSCSKDDDNSSTPTPVTPSGSYITAKVDGADFSSIIFGVSTATANRIGTGEDTLIMVLGGDLATNSISINLLGISAPGTYALNPSLDGTTIGYVSSSAATSWDTGNCDASGTLTVTALDNTKIEGTFSFVGKNGENCAAAAKNITNGAFRGVFVN